MFPFGISASSYIFYWGDCLLWISVTSYFNWARLLSDHCQCLLCQGACSLWDQCQYFLCRELVPFATSVSTYFAGNLSLLGPAPFLDCRELVHFGTSAIYYFVGSLFSLKSALILTLAGNFVPLVSSVITYALPGACSCCDQCQFLLCREGCPLWHQCQFLLC
jgi:hypothetical protein